MKNTQLQQTIEELKESSKKNKAPIWARVAKDLSKPTRSRRTVNLTKIEKYTKDGESIIVPGKVLGTGIIAKKATVVAYQFSETAAKKIAAAGGSIKTISEELKKNTKGSKLRIIG